MADKFSTKTFAKLQSAFSVIDKNSDGVITLDELEEMAQTLNSNSTIKSQLKNILEEADTDKNGFVDFQEFLSMINKYKNEKIQEYLLILFNLFDSNENGFISLDEGKKVMNYFYPSFSDQKLKDKFYQIDIDGDGLISFDDFKNYKIISK